MDTPPRAPASPRRYAPYARPAAPNVQNREKSNYHWHTVCAIRAALLRTYDDVYGLHDRVRRGEPVGERELQRVLMDMADVLTCGVCGKVRKGASPLKPPCRSVAAALPQVFCLLSPADARGVWGGPAPP